MKSLKVKGMSCQHCVMAVAKALNSVEGVKDVKVDLMSGLASYEETKPVDHKIIEDAIKKAGYEVG